MPMKPVKRGRKVWCLADNTNRFVANFDEVTLGARVVISRTKHLEGKNHHVYCDNFFTSPYLFLKLLQQGFYANGTLHVLKFKSIFRGGSFVRQTTNWLDNQVVKTSSTNVQLDAVGTIQRTMKDGTKGESRCPQHTKGAWQIKRRFLKMIYSQLSMQIA